MGQRTKEWGWEFFFVSYSMYTRSSYATNEIIYLSSHGLHGLASLVWDILDCGGRFEKNVLVRIAHDMLMLFQPPSSCFDMNDMFAVAMEGLEVSNMNS